MAFNGAGVFNRLYSFVTDRANGIKILAQKMDDEMAGFATGLSNVICRDGQSTISADLPFSGRKITGYGSTSTPSARTDVPQIGQVQDGGFLYAATAGTDTYTATPAPAITAYVTGQVFHLLVGNPNTVTGPTINLNGVGAKTVVRADNTTLLVGDLSGIHAFEYDGTSLRVLNPKVATTVRGALAWNSANQSLSDSTTTALTFDSESYDTDSIHSIISNTSRMTVPTGVTKIQLFGQVTFAANSTGIRTVNILKNGAGAFAGQPLGGQNALGSGSNHPVPVMSPVLTVTGGDYFEIVAFQNSGGALNAVGASSGANSWLALRVIQ